MGSNYLKAPIEPMQWARNGMYPDASPCGELAERTNFVTKYRLKEIGRFMTPLQAIPASGGSGERVRWRFAFHASPGATVIIVKALLATTASEASASPYARVRIQDGTPTTIGDAELHWGGVASDPGDAPDTFGIQKTYIGDSSGIVAIEGGADYYGTVSDIDAARIVAVTVWEGSLFTANVVDEGIAAFTPIYDRDRDRVSKVLRAAWKEAGAHLFNWSVDHDSAARTTTSATAKNLINNSSTTVTAATPGFTLDLRHRERISEGTVPCVFKAYGSSTDLSYVHLVDSTGTVLATVEISITGSPGWFGTTVALPATLAKYDLMYSSETFETGTVYAASLYQWETGS